MSDKPKFENAIDDLIDTKYLSTALDFIAYLKSNKISITWTNTNTWKAVKKGIPLCYIKAGIEHKTGASCYTKNVDSTTEKGSWVILPHIANLENTGAHATDGYEEILSDVAAFDMICDKVRPCTDCGNTKKCAPGITVNFWGRELHNRCKFIALPFLDPTPEELKCAQTLITTYYDIKSK